MSIKNPIVAEGLANRTQSLRKMCQDLEQEFLRIEEQLEETQPQLETLYGQPYTYIHHYGCGRDCRGCPHPSLARLPAHAEWAHQNGNQEKIHEIQQNFHRLVRRRSRLLHLLQQMQMSVYRLGGASHRRDESA